MRSSPTVGFTSSPTSWSTPVVSSAPTSSGPKTCTSTSGTTRVSDELSKIMTRAYRDVREMVEREKITYREAAFAIGVARVVHVAELRGFI